MKYVLSRNTLGKSPDRWMYREEGQRPTESISVSSLIARNVVFHLGDDEEAGMGCKVVAVAEHVETQDVPTGRDPLSISMRIDPWKGVFIDGKNNDVSTGNTFDSLLLTPTGGIYGVFAMQADTSIEKSSVTGDPTPVGGLLPVIAPADAVSNTDTEGVSADGLAAAAETGRPSVSDSTSDAADLVPGRVSPPSQGEAAASDSHTDVAGVTNEGNSPPSATPPATSVSSSGSAGDVPDGSLLVTGDTLAAAEPPQNTDAVKEVRPGCSSPGESGATASV